MVESSIDLARHLRSADTVIWGQACAEPLALTTALVEQAAAIGGLRCFLGITAPGGADLASLADVRFLAYGGGGGTRRLDADHRLDVLPSRYSDLPDLLERRRVPIDVAFVQVTPDPTARAFRLSLAAEYLVAAVRAARVVIAQVNEAAPHTPDSPVLHADDITVLVPSDGAPLEVATAAASAVDEAIAAHVAGLVEDGATLQTGVGTLPEAVVRGLDGHRDLGVHSGAIGDAIAGLTESGAITNRLKPFDAGVSVGGVLIGSQRLFDFAHGNAALALRDTRYTHDAAVLASLPRLTTINAAIEVDLTGQINTEVAAGRYVGAAGGSLDFARGAALAPDGVPITVLRSTAGGRSTITVDLCGPVAIPRSEAGWVVTEYGAVDLRGLTLAQRRERLISIAHPDHRAALDAAVPGAGEPAQSATSRENGQS